MAGISAVVPHDIGGPRVRIGPAPRGAFSLRVVVTTIATAPSVSWQQSSSRPNTDRKSGCTHPCLINLHLGSAGIPMPEHLHEVSHVPRSPRHLRRFQDPGEARSA